MKRCLKIVSLLFLLLPSACYVQGNVIDTKTGLIASVAAKTFSFQKGGTGALTVAYSMTTDTSGNFYITGDTGTPLDGQTQNGNYDMFVSKYNAAGVLQWTIQDGAPGATVYGLGVAVDSSGNVYVAGETNLNIDGQSMIGWQDLFISKYNSAGVHQWTVLDGGWSGYAFLGVTGMAIDTSGNVFVTGNSSTDIDGQTLHGNYDLFVTKYNSSGVLQWTVQDGASGGFVFPYGVTTDSSGNVYVTGGTNVALDGQSMHSSNDMFITVYNASGAWQQTIQDGPSSGTCNGQGIAVDSASNIYVTGGTTGPLDSQTLHGGTDLFVTKYNSAGVLQWTVQDGAASGSTNGWQLTLDSSANLYIVGKTSVAIDGQSNYSTADLFLTKYNSSGVRQWTAEDGSSAGGSTYGYGIAVGLSGDVYATGYTTLGIDGNTQHGTDDLFVTRYNSSGVLKP